MRQCLGMSLNKMSREKAFGILIIEDEEAMREVLAWEAREVAGDVTVASDGQEGLSLFDPGRHAVVLTDLRMPGADGMAVLQEVRQRSPDTPVIVITAYGDIPTAVKAMKAGAYDFIPKPFEREHLQAVLRKAMEVVRLRRRVADLEGRLEYGERPLIFASRAMEHVVNLVDRVAQSDVTVLLEGESGTGKELLARRLHARSFRRQGPFVAINCGAIPRDLLESELFGYVKGAFTGAVRDHKGRFEQASGGTLFLDEISELPQDLQPKLLRVLEERLIPVLGLEGEREADVRIVAATNRNLQEEVANGRFRSDLFFRLNVVHIRVPPLRERPEDIPLLVQYFLKKHATDSPPEVEAQAMALLRSYWWPGNVREVENLCLRFCLLAQGGRVTLAMVKEALPDGAPLRKDDGQPQTLWAVERAAIERALRECGYNQSRAARALGIPRHVLLYRMKKFGITTPREKEGE